MDNWTDVTLPTRTGMPHWPGDPDVAVTRTLDLERGDGCNVSRLELCTHSGTHMDAPRHYISGGKTIDEFPPEIAVGPARVVQVNDPVAVTMQDCQHAQIRAGERILFRTRNSSHDPNSPFREDFIYIAADAARFLADTGVVLVGIDYMSVGGWAKDGVETHQALLGKGIWVIENLDLSLIEPGHYEMICLPLKIMGGDGAPCRVLLRKPVPEMLR